MKRGKKILFVVLLIIILLIPLIYNKINNKVVLEEAKVVKVIDGDTIEISSGEKIRLLGINTPEKKQNCYEKAKEQLTELILNKTILLEKDLEDKDRYERLLRYIYTINAEQDRDIFVNEELLKLGLANYYPYNRELKYGKKLEKAEKYAKDNKVGCLWENYEYSPDSCIKIKEFHYDEGEDKTQLNNEYIIFENSCDSVNMNNWTISDLANHQYKLKNFVFPSESEFVFYTGKGEDNKTALFWQQNKMPIWNNNGDTLYLRNSDGNLVLLESY